MSRKSSVVWPLLGIVGGTALLSLAAVVYFARVLPGKLSQLEQGAGVLWYTPEEQADAVEQAERIVREREA